MTSQEFCQQAYLAAVQGLCANPNLPLQPAKETVKYVHTLAVKIAEQALTLPEPDKR